MENEKVKKYIVSFGIRLPSGGLKLFFAVFCLLALVAVLSGIYCLITWSVKLLSATAICGILAAIWLFFLHSTSETNFGMNRISFDKKGIKFYTSSKTYNLDWDACVDGGIIKNLLGLEWVYVTDHELSDGEKKNFPENTELGVMYFEYDTPTYEEFSKFVPEAIGAKIAARKSELKIKETIK